jgi:predicted DCC family thiol-disulfide oxidoreductase YuxK
LFTWPKLKELLGADLRSLAVARIAMGALILIDLIHRSTDLVAHYTDIGVFPRVAAIENAYSRWTFSLHMMNGTWQVQAMLFVVAAVFGVALMVGYRTRLATVVSWLLLLSLQNRNWVILAGDNLLRVLLFWAIFLPWGARFSVDKLRNPSWDDAPNQCLSWGTAAYFFQIVFVFWFGIILKSGPEWRDGSAVYYALSFEQITTSVGVHLLQIPILLKPLTFAAFGVEALGPLLLFSPIRTGPIRTIGLLLLLCLTLGMALMLNVGLFIWTTAVCLLGLLPSWFWERVGAWLGKNDGRKVVAYFDRNCGFCKHTVRVIRGLFPAEHVSFAAAQSDPEVEAEMRRQNSWVVVDESGTCHFRYDGALVLASASQVLRPLVPLFSRSIVKKIGERIYRLLAVHRTVVCRPSTEITTQPSLLTLNRQ